MRSGFFRSFTAALFIVVAFANCNVAGAASFADDAKEAAGKASIKLGEIPALQSLLTKFGAKKIANMELKNTSFEGGVLTADVTFIKINWRFTAYSGGDIKNTFFTFRPTSTVSFQKMFKKVPGIELLDILVFDDQMFALSAANLEIDAADLPPGARKEIDRFYEGGKGYTFEVAQGLKLFGALDLGESKTLNDAIKFLGGKSSKVQMTAALSTNVLDAMLGGSLPAPALTMTATLPTFRPKIGGVIQLPANVQFGFTTELTSEGASVGLAANTDFKIGGQTVPMTMTETISLDTSGAPEIGVTMSIFEGEPWKNAFGLKFLTIEDYAMEFTADATGTLSVGTSGKTSLGGKGFRVATSAQIGVMTSGIPLPEIISLEVDDGPNKIGAVSLKDYLSIYTELLKATSGGHIKVPLDVVPDVAIAGTKVGEGPKLNLNLEVGGGFGFDMAGALRILGTNVATVETAFMSADEGIEIKANTKKIGVGPISLPNAQIHIVARADREAGTFPPPKILIGAEAFSLFGAKSRLDITMFVSSATMAANANFGELFKFNLKAYAGIEKLKKFTDLANTDFYLIGTLQSDPAEWIRTAGKDAAKKSLDTLKSGFDAALKNLKAAEADVTKLNASIVAMRAKIIKERASSTNSIKSAEAEVAKLQSSINALDGQIRGNKSKIQKCDQKKRLCFKAAGIKKCKSVPNYPARGVCKVKNSPFEVAISGLNVAKKGVVASKVTAQKSLEVLRKGLAVIPVDMDPRIVALFSALHTAKISLIAAKEAAKGITGFADLLTKGVAAAGKADVFALERGSIRGSLQQGLKGEPVVLDMAFRLLGKSYNNMFAFSLKDWKFNAKQMEVVALAAAVKTIIKLGREAKVVPHAVLRDVEELYLTRQAEVDRLVAIALEGGGVVEPEGVEDMSASVAASQEITEVQSLASQQVILDATEKLQQIKDKAYQALLTELEKSQGVLELNNGWLAFGGEYGKPSVKRSGDIVIISGLIKLGKYEQLATLPAALRPPQRLVFDLNNHEKSSRIDVSPNGQIRWVAGGKDHKWLSLSGISYSLKPKGNLPLTNRWVTFGGEYKTPTYAKSGDIVTVSGLIKNGKYGHLATLPAGYRPNKRIIFDLNNHGKSSRIDVTPNGKISWIKGGKDHKWLSLSGIIFNVSSKAPLKLAAKWTTYGKDYKTPTYAKSGDIVTVSGLIKNGQYGHLAYLPAGYRPSSRLIFDLNNNDKSSRIDVHPNGLIAWVGGGKDHKWLSLSGISFMAN